MRVTDKMKQSQMLSNLQKNRSEIGDLQSQAASGKRITKPSDDPVGSAKVLQNRTENRNLEQFDKNIQYAKTFMETSESTLAQLGDVIVRAKELAVQAASDSNRGEPREMIAEEVTQIYNSIVEMGNRRYADRFIFAGHKTTTNPFDKMGDYAGDDGQIQIQSHKGQYLPMNLPGSQVFLGRDLGYEGSARKEINVPESVEELQNYKSAQIEKDFLKEEAAQNQIETRGPASIGRVQRLDPVTGGKGVNIFTLVAGLEAALRTDDKKGIQESLEPLDQALNQINLARAELGGRMNQLSATSEGIQRSVVENKGTNSQIEDADLFKVMTDLSRSDTTLKATLETSSRIGTQSLLDFLR